MTERSRPVTSEAHSAPPREAEDRARPSVVMIRTFTCAETDKTNKPDGDAVRLGLHKETLVSPAGSPKDGNGTDQWVLRGKLVVESIFRLPEGPGGG